MCKSFIKIRADVNARDEYGMTPLHLVKSDEVAQKLIEANADIFAPDRTGRKPINMSPLKP